MRILAVSGSLRDASSNTALLQAVQALAPAEVEVVIYKGLGELPHFNPDLEGADILSVSFWREQLRLADGVLISSPEYAHGVPGVLKNALDWVVGSGEFMGKPVALLGVTGRGAFVQASLSETIRVMDARLITDSAFFIPLPGNKIDTVGILARPDLNNCLDAALRVFMGAIVS